MSSRPTVLIVGCSGNTGYHAALALLESAKFNVMLLCRPESEGKPRITTLKQKGAQVRIGDMVEDSIEDLQKHVLKGVEILVITVSSLILDQQRNILIAASKCPSIKRVVPSEFAIVHLSGDMATKSQILNKQLGIRELVKQLGLPYTYINVGWWMQLILPYPSLDTGYFAQRSRLFMGAGTVKTAVTSLVDIGQLVALVLDDPRTINAYVFGCGDEVSLDEIYDVAEKVSGEDMRSKRVSIKAEDIPARLAEAQKNYELSPSRFALGMQTIHIAYHAMFVEGVNTTDVAVNKLGYLDARTLYPETFKPQNLEEFAKEFYGGRVADLVYPSYPSRND